MPNHPSIKKFLQIQEKHQFSFSLGERPIDWLRWVEVKTGTQQWKILVYDESHDLSDQNPLLSLYLTLYTLEDYAETDDYLEWSKENMVKPPEFLDYYRSIATIHAEIKELLGQIDSYISPMDYELRAGEYAALLDWKSLE